MHSKLALTKLQALLIIDIIIVGLASTGYYYIQTFSGPGTSVSPSPSPSGSPEPFPIPEEFQLSVFALNQTQGLEGEPLGASINVTNIGGTSGNTSIYLLIDGQPSGTRTIQLAPQETQNVQFVFTATEGTHLVKIGSFEGTINVLSKFRITDLAINRTEAGIGEPIGISVKVANIGTVSGTYPLALKINGEIKDTRNVTVNGGATATIQFVVIESVERTYSVQISDLSGTFKVTPAALPPKPAEFQLSDLAIDPAVVTIGSPVTVSVKVSNRGEVSGTYLLDLVVNEASAQTKSVSLAGGETMTVSFNVTGNSAGTYSVRIGALSGSFGVQEPSKIRLVSMIVKPYEVWVGQQVAIEVRANNPGAETGTLLVKLVIDGVTEETKTVEVEGGGNVVVDFYVTAKSEGIHNVNVNGLVGGFEVVKNGYHTLSINISPSGDADFTLVLPSGTREAHKTYYTALLPEGTYTVEMPWSDPSHPDITFIKWDDGSANPIRTITLSSRMSLTAQYTGSSSCPSLYIWDGTRFVYVSEISNHGWLGYIKCKNSTNGEVPFTFYRNNPWDYIPLNSSQLKQSNGYYNLTLEQRWNEIFYLDQAYLVMADHSADVNVYSTMVEEYLNPNYMGKIYTVAKNPLAPISAVNENGQNILSQISKIDEVFTSGVNGIQSPSWDKITWNKVTLGLGDLTNAKQIKLVVRAVVDWGSPADYETWLGNFFDPSVPDGIAVTPPPVMEVKDASGNWVPVPVSRQFPIPPDVLPRTYVVDLTGLFPTNDYSLRISNFWNVTFDYIGIDTTSQQNVTIHKIDPLATLWQQFNPNSTSSGNYTKYGDVTPLVLKEDNKFVIGRQGDTVSLKFPIQNVAPVKEGMVRDIFLYESTWFKDANGNWGFGFGFTSDPLPYSYMSSFPYPSSESYPFDPEHLSYIREWNTRVIPPIT
jgi:hypothetical protein